MTIGSIKGKYDVYIGDGGGNATIKKLKNPAEKDLFETHRSSPYGNYIRKIYRHYDNSERVIYLTVLAEKEKVLRLEKELEEQLRLFVRVTVYSSEYDGYLYLKVYSPFASDAESMVTIGSIKGKYDVYIGDGGGNATIKKLKKLYHHSSVH